MAGAGSAAAPDRLGRSAAAAVVGELLRPLAGLAAAVPFPLGRLLAVLAGLVVAGAAQDRLGLEVLVALAAAVGPDHQHSAAQVVRGRSFFIGQKGTKMKYAWLEATTIRDICPGNPAEFYHPDVAAHYDTEVPDDAENGDTWDGTTLTKKPVPVAPAPVAPVPPKVSVIEYKMLFTSAERIAVKASTDPVIIDLQELMNDPRTVNVDLSLKSISDALDYMTYLGLIAPGRKAEILTGEIQ